MLYLGQRPKVRSPEMQRALNAAEGYSYFGLAREALAALDAVPSSQPPDVAMLLARNRVLLQASQWKKVQECARQALVEFPSEGEFTVQLAFALHMLHEGDEAVEVLSAAPDWIRKTGILHYNLACYEARFGNLTTARQCINAAIEMNAAMKKNAKEDPDLESLWN